MWTRACAALAVAGRRACTTSLSSQATAADRPGTRPNIVLILTDDEDVASRSSCRRPRHCWRTPAPPSETSSSATRSAVRRASILRGRYAHNTQVVGNEVPYGGFEKLRQRGLEESTIATAAGRRRTAPRWSASTSTAMRPRLTGCRRGGATGTPPATPSSCDYVLNENGRIVVYGREPEDYLNDVLTEKAVAVIERAAAAQAVLPLRLDLDPATPAASPPRRKDLFVDAELPRPPAFNDPTWATSRGSSRSASLDQARSPGSRTSTAGGCARCRRSTTWSSASSRPLCASSVSITYIVYTSDNGFHMGEHRLIAGKDTPYEEDLRVPMVMRGPGVPEGHGSRPWRSTSISPRPSPRWPGSSRRPSSTAARLPLLADATQPWRQSFLIERRRLEEHFIDYAEQQGMSGEQLERHAYFDGLRTPHWSVEYGSGERELYDLARDPHQLQNVIRDADPTLLATLAERLDALAGCAGRHTREARGSAA